MRRRPDGPCTVLSTQAWCKWARLQSWQPIRWLPSSLPTRVAGELRVCACVFTEMGEPGDYQGICVRLVLRKTMKKIRLHRPVIWEVRSSDLGLWYQIGDSLRYCICTVLYGVWPSFCERVPSCAKEHRAPALGTQELTSARLLRVLVF